MKLIPRELRRPDPGHHEALDKVIEASVRAGIATPSLLRRADGARQRAVSRIPARGNVVPDMMATHGWTFARLVANRELSDEFDSVDEQWRPLVLARASGVGNCGELALEAALQMAMLGLGESCFVAVSEVEDHCWAEVHAPLGDGIQRIVIDPWSSGPAVPMELYFREEPSKRRLTSAPSRKEALELNRDIDAAVQGCRPALWEKYRDCLYRVESASLIELRAYRYETEGGGLYPEQVSVDPTLVAGKPPLRRRRPCVATRHPDDRPEPASQSEGTFGTEFHW